MTDSEIIKEYLEKERTAKEKPGKSYSTRSKTAGKPKTPKGKSAPSTVTYQVLLSKGTDCIIEKDKNGKKEQFIFLPSEDTYGIKTNRSYCEASYIDDQIDDFFKELPEEGLKVENRIFHTIKPSDANDILFMAKYYPAECKKGILSLETCGMANRIEEKRIVWNYLAKNTPFLRNPKKYNKALLDFLEDIRKLKGMDPVKKFISVYQASSMESMNSDFNFGISNFDDGISNLDVMDPLSIEELSEYLCYDLYEQGYRDVPIRYYLSYLRNQKKLKEMGCQDTGDFPYPKNFREEIRKTSYLLSYESASCSTNEMSFNDQYRMLKETIPEMDGFLIPDHYISACNDSLKMGYQAKKVFEDGSLVLFYQKDEEPVLQIQIDQDGEGYRITGVKGKYERETLTEEEKAVLREWSKNTGVRLPF